MNNVVKHSAKRLAKGQYAYRGRTIERNEDRANGCYDAWSVNSANIYGETLKSCKAQIDAKLDTKVETKEVETKTMSTETALLKTKDIAEKLDTDLIIAKMAEIRTNIKLYNTFNILRDELVKRLGEDKVDDIIDEMRYSIKEISVFTEGVIWSDLVDSSIKDKETYFKETVNKSDVRAILYTLISNDKIKGDWSAEIENGYTTFICDLGHKTVKMSIK